MSKQELTKQEVDGQWKMKGEDFELYKIRKMVWVDVSSTRIEKLSEMHIDTNRNSLISTTQERQSCNRVMYITIARMPPMPLDVFRAHFELVELPKDYTLDNEIKHAMLQVAPVHQLKWDEMSTEQTIKAMDFIREFWDKNVQEIITMQHSMVVEALDIKPQEASND